MDAPGTSLSFELETKNTQASEKDRSWLGHEEEADIGRRATNDTAVRRLAPPFHGGTDQGAWHGIGENVWADLYLFQRPILLK
ncbi:MAG TPA: hypothetical protein DCR97_07835 [Deltaproteobacteria bacterium]|nr:hypothetical protein [Deltaproteobacteria bacterium]